MTWGIEEAEQQFDELLRRTLEEGPQIVARDGEEVVVFVAAEEYRRARRDGDAAA